MHAHASLTMLDAILGLIQFKGVNIYIIILYAETDFIEHSNWPVMKERSELAKKVYTSEPKSILVWVHIGGSREACEEKKFIHFNLLVCQGEGQDMQTKWPSGSLDSRLNVLPKPVNSL